MLKENLRKTLRDQRNNLPQKEKKSRLILEHLLSSSKFQKASVVMLYRSAKGEVDTEILRQKCRELGKTCVFPKCVSKTEMIAVLAEEDDFSVSEFGILEPVSNEEFPKDRIDCIIVPALGFDRKHYRMGYGGGYYDRYLANYHGITFGLCYSDLLMETVFPDEWDIPVTVVVTEEEILEKNEEIS